MVYVKLDGISALVNIVNNNSDVEIDDMQALTILAIKSIAYSRPLNEIVIALKSIISEPNYWEDDEKKDAVISKMTAFSEAFYNEYKVNGFTAEFQIKLNPESTDAAVKKGFLVPMAFVDEEAAKSTSKAKVEEEEEVKPKDPACDYKIQYNEWSEEQRRNIPTSELDNYIVTPQSLIVANKIKYRLDLVNKRLEEGMSADKAIGNDYINLLLVGSPGTGKTKMLHAIAEMTGMPIYTIPISKNTEEDVFEGKNKVVEGKITYVETDFVKAYENGGIIVLEEVNLADPAVIMGSIGQAMERPFVIKKDGYININRHPMCVIVATMNTGTAGSKKVNQALSSRFKQTITLNDPDSSIFVQILKTHYPKARTCKWVYDSYNKIKNYLSSADVNREDLGQNLSMRACFGALENIEEGLDGRTAIINSIVGKIAENDLEIANQIINNIVESLPKLKS
jgi:hypothetical protein